MLATVENPLSDVPSRDFNETCFFTLDQRLHPILSFLGVVDLCPCIASSKPIHLTVFMTHGVVILDAVREEKLSAFFTCLPPSITSQFCDCRRIRSDSRSNTTSRRLTAELCKHLKCLVKDIFLLLKCHVCWILVAITMESNLVAGIADSRTVFWKCFECMSRNEPACFDVVFVEKLE